ncbi:MAG: MBL fold metallo-hydrolase [Clostridia bacterium]|nr:MBL fold metallo-hydrolase [Clostridia bacterium]
MHLIYDDLYQFSQFREDINLSTHQYLLLKSKPILIHTGTHEAAKANLPEIEKLLDGKELTAVFVSHMGADECGGLSVILERWPHAQVICSEHTARNLKGFGYNAELCISSPRMNYYGKDFDLKFIDYPADTHLYNGILMYEMNSGIFFSSDLMMRAGDGAGKVTTSSWKDEVNATNTRQVPNRTMVHDLKRDLMGITPKFIAVGHGFCMKLD